VDAQSFVGFLQKENTTKKLHQLYGQSDQMHKIQNQSELERKQQEEESRVKCLIKYNSEFMIVWETIVALSFCVSMWMIPFNLATQFRLFGEMRTMELLIDFIIVLDILINFVSESVRDVTVIIYLKEAAKEYLTNGFFLDIIIVIPNLVTWERYEPIYYLKLLRIFHFKRFFIFFSMITKFI